jgi:hypothetical protein
VEQRVHFFGHVFCRVWAIFARIVIYNVYMVDGWLIYIYIYIFYCAVRYEDEDVACTEKLWWTALPMGLQLPST